MLVSSIYTVCLIYTCFSLQALKVLRTSEFLPYVVFIEAPDFEVLKAMNRSAIESGVVTKQLTVSVCSLKGPENPSFIHLLL